MLINISSEFFHSCPKNNLPIFFSIFQLRTWKITVSALTSVNFHGSFWNVARIIHSPKIVDRFHYGGSALLNMHIMDHGPFNEPASFSIPGLIFQAEVTKSVTKVGLQMLININSGFFYARFSNGRIMPWQCPSVRLSVCPSVCPSVRPSGFSGLFFNMLWDINLKLGIYIQ